MTRCEQIRQHAARLLNTYYLHIASQRQAHDPNKVEDLCASHLAIQLLTFKLSGRNMISPRRKLLQSGLAREATWTRHVVHPWCCAFALGHGAQHVHTRTQKSTKYFTPHAHQTFLLSLRGAWSPCPPIKSGAKKPTRFCQPAGGIALLAAPNPLAEAP